MTILPITALAVSSENCLIVGAGNSLSLVNSVGSCLVTKRAFTTRRIHLIEPVDCSCFAAAAHNALRLFAVDGKLMTFLHNVVLKNDRIISMRRSEFLSGKTTLILLLAHNTIEVCLPETMATVFRVKCVESSILYSGLLFGEDYGTLMCFSGTVYNEVLLWRPTVLNSDSQTATVLARLLDHTGVIFSISYSYQLRLLATSSDDRSVRIWPINVDDDVFDPEIKPIKIFFGHEGRVWRTIFTQNGLVSVGEDCQICLWDVDETCEHSLLVRSRAHHGRGIWSVLTDGKLIYTGGGDGGILKWTSLSDSENIAPITQLTLNCDTIREDDISINHIFFGISSDIIFLVLENGSVMSLKNGNTTLVESFNFLENYSVSSGVHNQLVALGGQCGIVCVLRLSSYSSFTFQINNIKIESLIWADGRLVACCSDGAISIWNIDDMVAIRSHRLELSVIKNNWITCAGFIAEFFVCGDRHGTLRCYCLNTGEVLHTLPRIHGSLGCTNILIADDMIYSCGRKGSILVHKISYKKFDLQRSFHLPIPWIVSLITDGCKYIAIGFKGNMLQAYSIEEDIVLSQLDCGGGHRSWDFLASGDVVFVRRKNIYKSKLCFSLPFIQIVPRLHGKHISAVVSYPFKTLGDVFVTAAEDNNIMVWKEASQFQRFFSLDTHSSSIRALFSIGDHRDPLNSCFVLSCGGRETFCIFHLFTNGSNLQVQTLLNVDSLSVNNDKDLSIKIDVQFMCLTMFPGEALNLQSGWIVILGGSDGSLVCFLLSEDFTCFNKFTLCSLSHCILSVVISMLDDKPIVIAGDSVGNLHYFIPNLADPSSININKYVLHEGACTVLDVVPFNMQNLVVFSGGDDGSVISTMLSLCKDTLSVEVKKKQVLHTSSVVSIDIADSVTLVSLGIDQRIVVSAIKNTSDLSPIVVFWTNVADPSSGYLLSDSLLVVGEGFESIRLW